MCSRLWSTKHLHAFIDLSLILWRRREARDGQVMAMVLTTSRTRMRMICYLEWLAPQRHLSSSWAADGQRFGQSYEGATPVREGRIWVRHMQRYTCISTPFDIALSKNIEITLVVPRWHYESCFTIIFPLAMSSMNNVLAHKSEQPTARCIALQNSCGYITDKSNTTMLVYEIFIGIYYV